MKRRIDLVFLVLVCAAVVAGTGKALFMPEDINEYENRYAEKLKAPTAESFLNGEFQDNTEAALADQIIGAESIKEGYHRLFSGFNAAVLGRVMELSAQSADAEAEDIPDGDEDVGPDAAELAHEPKPRHAPLTIADPGARYFTLPSGRLMLSGHLLYFPRPLEGEQSKLDARIASINKTIEKYPDIEFYVYFFEKETEGDFITGERSGVAEYLAANLNLDAEHYDYFSFDSFEEFDEWYYKTDHHFNNRGGYEAYKRLLGFLLPGEEPLVPTGEYQVGYYSGSKATGTDAGTYKDINACYSFDYPEMLTWENGAKIGYYGAEEYYAAKASDSGVLLNKVTYGQLFGQDSGEIRFETPSSANGSILTFGESFDNVLLRPLASHFGKLYSIDLRNYKAQMGHSFDLDAYLAAHPDIDRILLDGNLDFFVMNAFDLVE